MLLFVLLSTAFAGVWHGTTGSFTFGTTVQNARDVCMEANVPADCFGVADTTYMQATGATQGACTSTYTTTCSDFSQTYTIPGGACGSVSLAMKAKSQTDCTVAQGTAATYHFMTGTNAGTLAQSTGVTTDGCIEAVLPATCGGVDMTSVYTDSLSGVNSACANTYSYECTSLSNNAANSYLGTCGTTTMVFKFASSADCTSAQNAVTEAESAAQTAAGQSTCVDASSVFPNSQMTCADARTNIGCNLAVATACPRTCGACSSSAILSVVLAGLTALLFAL